ncbi:MAG: SIMPL domain-containing protein [Pelovirga sp.]
MSRRAFFMFPLFSLLLLVAACMPYPLASPSAAVAPDGSPMQQLRVQAEARVDALPDLLRLRLGVITEAQEADQAVTENSRRMTALMASLQQIGLTSDDLGTGQFQILPQWSQPPRPTPANWQRQIVGYRVINDLWVTTTRIDLAGELLGLAYRSGANQVGHLQFSVADQEEYQSRALALATRKAVRQAETLAAAAGAQLGQILSLNLDYSSNPPGGQPVMAEARLSSVADAVPVTPGKVEIQAGVSIVYQLLHSSSSQGSAHADH